MADLFSGVRTPLSKQLILEQVYDVAERLFNRDEQGVEVDPDNANWFVAPKYFLPNNWHHIARVTPLMIVFPTAYPEIPPVGFYMRESIKVASHVFAERVFHDALHEPLEKGWIWYCVYVNPGSWTPSPVRKPGDWKRGDNLWTYLMLINETLASPG